MRPIPAWFLLTLLLGLTALCVWQWHRETLLRWEIDTLRERLNLTESARHDLELRVKSADAEILRLTAKVAGLQKDASAPGKLEVAEKQSQQATEAVKQRDEAIAAQNKLLQQANTTLAKLTIERDSAVSKLNAMTRKLNQSKADP